MSSTSISSSSSGSIGSIMMHVTISGKLEPKDLVVL